ncbi:MAG TPA: YciI family protein [Propionibacteriaceae bacterium]
MLIASDETKNPGRETPEFGQWMEAWSEYNQLLLKGGHLVAGSGLQPTSTATTVRKTPGAASQVFDGPFAETKEQLGGFYVITARDLDEALELAEQLPIPAGCIEIRPLSFRVEV